MGRQKINEPTARKILSYKGQVNPATGRAYEGHEVAPGFGISVDTVLAIWGGRRWKCLADARQRRRVKPRHGRAVQGQVLALEGVVPVKEIARRLELGVSTVYAILRGERAGLVGRRPSRPSVARLCREHEIDAAGLAALRAARGGDPAAVGRPWGLTADEVAYLWRAGTRVRPPAARREPAGA
jgi:hypothetical protein